MSFLSGFDLLGMTNRIMCMRRPVFASPLSMMARIFFCLVVNHAAAPRGMCSVRTHHCLNLLLIAALLQSCLELILRGYVGRVVLVHLLLPVSSLSSTTLLPGVPSVPDCTHSRGMSPFCRTSCARCCLRMRCRLPAAMAVDVGGPSGRGALGGRRRWDATCIGCGLGRGWSVGPGEAAACVYMVTRPNCPAHNGGFFD